MKLIFLLILTISSSFVHAQKTSSNKNKTIQCLCITTGEYECDGYRVLQFKLSANAKSLTLISLDDESHNNSTKTKKTEVMKSTTAQIIDNNRIKFTLSGKMEKSFPSITINQSLQKLTAASHQKKDVQVELPEYIDESLATTWKFNKCKVLAL